MVATRDPAWEEAHTTLASRGGRKVRPMAEPAVTLTDYGIAVLCAVLAHLLLSAAPGSGFRGWFTTFFVATGAAALLGGTVHGFFPDESSTAHSFLWSATLLAIGVATLPAWAVGAKLLFVPRMARWIQTLAVAELVVYAFLVVFATSDFRLAIAMYLPASLFLLVALWIGWRRQRVPALRTAAVGLVLTLVAAAVQQLRVALHPVYFDHNTLYHVVQAVALVLLFVGARYLVGGEPRAMSSETT
jgi:hypothetical protein